VTTILQDDFEGTAGTSEFPKWTEVHQEGDASATISTDMANTGNCSGRLSATTSDSSMVYIRKDLGGAKTDVWASGWFNVTEAGVDGNDVPYLRFFDGPNRIVDVFRQNEGGDAWLRTANPDPNNPWDYVQLGAMMPLDTWHQVMLHVAPNGATSTIEVWIDGIRLYHNTLYDLFAATQLTTVQLGAEHYQQEMIEYVDDVCIGAN
jgi:hypothetical protein